MLKSRTFIFLIVSICWLFLVLFPWQGWLWDFEILRFALGVIVFFIPGVFAFLYLSGGQVISLRILLGGFIVSIFVTGVLGVLARLLQLNFAFIRWVFALWGMWMIFVHASRHIRIELPKITRLEATLLVVSLSGAVYFASIASPPLIHDDAFTYNAMLYYFQHAPVLNFDFPDALSRLEIPRFWIAYWPLVEALLSAFSGVDGLMITGILFPPLLAVFSFLCVYVLARTLGLSRILSAAAILAQGFSLMRLTRYNQPGHLFFQRLTEDKVTAAFVIALVFIILAVEYFDAPSRRKLLLVWIAAWAAAFTHPVQYGMACMIVAIYGLPSLLAGSRRSKYFSLIGVMASVALVPYLFRFGGGEYSQSLSFSLEDVAANDEFARFGVRRVDIIEGTPFYGISHYLTVGLPYEVSVISVIVSLFFFRRNRAAQYILSFFLVLGFAMLPYTGWIVGIFTTPFQLWRLTWLAPFGIAFAFLIWFGVEVMQKVGLLNCFGGRLLPLFHISVYAALIALVIFVRPWTLNNVEKSNVDVAGLYANYVSTGRRMNELNVEGMPVIVGGPDETTASIIPSLTVKFEPMFFRVAAGSEKNRLWRLLVGDSTPAELRFALFRENNVEYVLLKGRPEWISVLAERYPENVLFLFRDQRFALYKLTY